MIYIKSEAVGILVGTKVSDLLKIEMDYSIMKYRDIIIEKFLFKKLKDEGINTLTANKGSKLHNDYLKGRFKCLSLEEYTEILKKCL